MSKVSLIFRRSPNTLMVLKSGKAQKILESHFKGEVISVKVVNSIAIAEVKVKMYDVNYHEFLSFHKIHGRWLIVNKMVSDENK
ncbi:MAG: nuclear transport factor 2 family protein [Ginsengibacter sp.]